MGGKINFIWADQGGPKNKLPRGNIFFKRGSVYLNVWNKGDGWKMTCGEGPKNIYYQIKGGFYPEHIAAVDKIENGADLPKNLLFSRLHFLTVFFRHQNKFFVTYSSVIALYCNWAFSSYIPHSFVLFVVPFRIKFLVRVNSVLRALNLIHFQNSSWYIL